MNAIQRWSPSAQAFWDPFRMLDSWDPKSSWTSMDDGLDVYEDDGKIFAEASLPGIKADEVNVTYENGMLRIQAETEQPKKTSKKRKDYKQERVRSFEYMTTLPRPVNADKMKADLEEGVLKVSAPISEQALPKQIPVSA